MTKYWRRFVLWFRGLFGLDSWVIGHRAKQTSILMSKKDAEKWARKRGYRYIRKTSGFRRRIVRLQ